MQEGYIFDKAKSQKELKRLECFGVTFTKPTWSEDLCEWLYNNRSAKMAYDGSNPCEKICYTQNKHTENPSLKLEL